MTSELRRLMKLYARMGTRKLVGLLLGPALLALIAAAPLALTSEQQGLLGVLAMTVVYWIFRPVPLPVTSMFALALTVMMDVASGRRVFSAFSSPTLFLLIGGFILTQAMVKYGLGQRIALHVLAVPAIAHSTYRIIFVFGGLAALLSSVMDNGALAAMLLPVAIGLIDALRPELAPGRSGTSAGHLQFGTALLLILAYGATVGALLTPWGDSANLVGWQFIHERYPRVEVGTWMMVAFPIVTVLFGLLAAVVVVINRPEVAHLPAARAIIARHRRQLGPMSRGERNTAIAFGLAVALWLLPPVAGLIMGTGSALHMLLVDRLHPAVVALVAASLLFVLPLGQDAQTTLRWRDTKHMDWGPVLLVGSALALGKMMAHTGLTEVIGEVMARSVTGLEPGVVYFLCASTALMISELSTNMVSVSVVVPLLPSLTASSGVDTLAAVLITTFSSIYGFMLPISTSANAIVYGSGRIPFGRMALTGLIVDITGIVVIVTGVRVMLLVLGM